jgi:hypothetical protein
VNDGRTEAEQADEYEAPKLAELGRLDELTQLDSNSSIDGTTD